MNQKNPDDRSVDKKRTSSKKRGHVQDFAENEFMELVKHNLEVPIKLFHL